MSRADKFEDEKRRIMHSCFSKRDNDGVGMWGFFRNVPSDTLRLENFTINLLIPPLM